MPTQRQLRVNKLLRAEIADILQHEIRDPLIGFVTVTDVEISPDFTHANVFISVLGDAEAKQETWKGVRRAGKRIRALLYERITLRRIPKLSFRLDETAERAQRIEELLRDAAPEDNGDDDLALPE